MSEQQAKVLDLPNLLNCKYNGDGDIAGYLDRFQRVVMSRRSLPEEELLESLLYGNIKKEPSLKTLIDMYKVTSPHRVGGGKRSCVELMSLIRTELEERHRIEFANMKRDRPVYGELSGRCKTMKSKGSCPKRKDCPFAASHDEDQQAYKKIKERPETIFWSR